MTQFIPSHETTFPFTCVLFPNLKLDVLFPDLFWVCFFSTLPLASWPSLANSSSGPHASRQRKVRAVETLGPVLQGPVLQGPVLLGPVLLGPFLTPVC